MNTAAYNSSLSLCVYRLYQHEVGLSCAKNEKFGYGVAVFQGVTNIAINSELIMECYWITV